MNYRVELIWNREFNFVSFGTPHDNMGDAIRAARAIENMGDGTCVKETRIVDDEGNVKWQYGDLV